MTPAQAIDMYTLLYDYNAVLEDLKTVSFRPILINLNFLAFCGNISLQFVSQLRLLFVEGYAYCGKIVLAIF
jgi:hypothetical protein